MGGDRDEAVQLHKVLEEEARILSYWEQQIRRWEDECERAELVRARYGETQFWDHLCAEEVLAPERASKEFKIDAPATGGLRPDCD